MKYAVLLIGLALSGAAAAQHSHGEMQSPARAAPNNTERPALAEQPLFFDAEVRAVDRQSGKVTLKHGPIPIFDMPSTTTAYSVKDASMLDPVEVGNKIRFTAVLQGRVLIITKIVPAN